MPIPSDLVGWTGSARLTGPSTLNGTVATSNADFRVTFAGQSSTGTKTLVAGHYLLTVWATSGNDRYTVAQYPVTITADLSVGTPAQRFAVKMLPIIEAAIVARISGTADGGIEGYAIDGVSVSKIPLEKLEQLRAKYSAEVAAIQNPNSPFGSVKFAFSPAGSAVGIQRRYG